jgi:hypothetical protein
MIAFLAALVLASTQQAPAREICLLNSLSEKVEFTFFVPGEPVPKGGYPIAEIEGGGQKCLAAPKEMISVLAKVSKDATVACNPSVVREYILYGLGRGPDGLVCEEVLMQVPAP